MHLDNKYDVINPLKEPDVQKNQVETVANLIGSLLNRMKDVDKNVLVMNTEIEDIKLSLSGKPM